MTVEVLDGLGAPREKLVRFPVDGCRGLYLQVTKTGVRSWVYRYRAPLGTERTFTIGQYPSWSAKKAILKADALRDEVREGKDPAGYLRIFDVPSKVGRARNIREGQEVQRVIAAQRAADQTPSPVVPPEPVVEEVPILRKVAEAFFEEHVKVKNRPSFIKQQRWRLDKYVLPELGDMPVDQITPVTITRFLDKIAVTAPVTSNRVLVTLRKMFNWASRRFDAVAKMGNPCIGHEPQEEQPVQTRLQADDVQRLGEAWMASTDPRKYACIFPLLTGCRRGVVMNLGKAEASKEESVLRFGKDLDGLKGTRILYVPPVAWDILGKIPTEGITPEVLTKGWNKLREAAKVECSLHDLRRSFISFGVDLQYSPDLLSAILGHSQGQKKLQKTYLVPADLKVPADKTLAGIAAKIGEHIAILMGLVKPKAILGPVKQAKPTKAVRKSG